MVLAMPAAAWRQRTPLFWAFAFSLAVHAALLMLRIADPQRFERLFGAEPLEVVLVNARSDQARERAQALAQVNLAGGGEAERGRATSPLPPAEALAIGNAPDDARRRAV